MFTPRVSVTVNPRSFVESWSISSIGLDTLLWLWYTGETVRASQVSLVAKHVSSTLLVSSHLWSLFSLHQWSVDCENLREAAGFSNPIRSFSVFCIPHEPLPYHYVGLFIVHLINSVNPLLLWYVIFGWCFWFALQLKLSNILLLRLHINQLLQSSAWVFEWLFSLPSTGGSPAGVDGIHTISQSGLTNECVDTEWRE